jgi:branched-chain amino acid transport system permease protein
VAADASAPTLGARFKRPSLIGGLGLLLVGALAVLMLAELVAHGSLTAQATLIGLTTGSVYALIALGYTLVYGILELINFAHGDVFMLGGMFTITFSTAFFNLHHGQGIVIVPIVFATLLLAMLACGVINATIEFIAYRPLRGAPRLAPLITAIGVSFIIQDIGLAWKGPEYVIAPDVFPHSDVFSVAGVNYQWNHLLVVIITISFTFLIAGALAGAAGTLYSLWATSVRFDQGFQLGLISFTAAVLGGIGNLPGAVLGAVTIGLIQAWNEALPWMPGSDWTQSIVFSILILILVFRPEGLLGEKTPEGG